MSYSVRALLAGGREPIATITSAASEGCAAASSCTLSSDSLKTSVKVQERNAGQGTLEQDVPNMHVVHTLPYPMVCSGWQVCDEPLQLHPPSRLQRMNCSAAFSNAAAPATCAACSHLRAVLGLISS
jgi:hypothetical protein